MLTVTIKDNKHNQMILILTWTLENYSNY